MTFRPTIRLTFPFLGDDVAKHTCFGNSETFRHFMQLSLQGKMSLLLFTKYNLRLHIKTIISKSPRDETLTLAFKMLQQVQETIATPRERERER